MTQKNLSATSYGPQTRRNLFLPDALLENIKAIAAHKKVSYSEVIRQALSAYVVECAPKQKPEANA